MSRSQKSRMTYSPSVDALAIVFAPRPAGDPVTRTIAPGITADYIDKQLVGFEILGASALIPKAALENIGPAGELIDLKQAAKESKRESQTIWAAIKRGAIEGAFKRGRSWVMPRVSLVNYLESLPPEGRPPKNKRAPKRKRVKAPAKD